jgi:hypothetical protein
MGHIFNLAIQTYQEVPIDPTQPAGYSGRVEPSVWQQMGVALHDSVYRVLSFFIRLLPGLLALVLAIAILTAIGAGVSYLLRRILTAVNFDERIARNRAVDISSSIQDWAPSHSPTVLVARAAFWCCVVLGFVIGISAFDASYSSTTQMSALLLPYLTHSVGAIVLLIVGNLIARFLARSVLIGAVNAKLSYARFLSLGVKWLVLVLTAAMVLDHLGIGGNIVELAFGILFGGIVLTLALAIGMGSRELVSRSLERQADRMPPRPVETPVKASEQLRHF